MKTTERNIGDKIFDILVYIFVTIAVLVCIYPFIYIVSVSISSGTAVNRGEVWLYPVDMNFEAMKTVLRHKQLWISFANTFYYTIVGTFLNIVFTCLAAYPLSGEVFLRRRLNFLLAFTMYFSGA